MARLTFKAYARNIEAKSGKTPEYFWKLAMKKGFVKRGHTVAKHSEMLACSSQRSDSDTFMRISSSGSSVCEQMNRKSVLKRDGGPLPADFRNQNRA